jgi:ABC-type sugar transport system permease subunit
MTLDIKARAKGAKHLPAGARGLRARLRWALRNRQLHLGIIVLVPTLLWYIVLQAGPVLEAFWFALYHVELTSLRSWTDLIQTSYFVGALHFQHLFDPTLNPQFWPGTLRSVVWTLLQFVYVLPLGLLLSVSLARISRGRTFYQIAILVPFVTPTVAVALMMGKLFDPASGGINGALRALGLPTSQWLHDPILALPLAAAIGAWRWLGFYIIIMTAGILNIPKDIDEAAQVDGTGAWQRFWFITLPLLGHILTLVSVLLLVNSMQEYTLPYTLTGGTQQFTMGEFHPIDYGPSDSLVLLNLALYKQTFGGAFVAFGPASAGAVLELVFVLAGSILLLKVLRPKWSY